MAFSDLTPEQQSVLAEHVRKTETGRETMRPNARPPDNKHWEVL